MKKTVYTNGSSARWLEASEISLNQLGYQTDRDDILLSVKAKKNQEPFYVNIKKLETGKIRIQMEASCEEDISQFMHNLAKVYKSGSSKAPKDLKAVKKNQETKTNNPEEKREKIRKQNKGCAIGCLGIVFVFAIIVAVAVAFGGSNNSDQTTQSANAMDLNACYSSLINQERALNDLINKYQTGEESPANAAERISGLADGIGNTINAINGNADSKYKESLISLATAFKGIATHYSNYIKTGSQSELDSATTLQQQLESLKSSVEEAK